MYVLISILTLSFLVPCAKQKALLLIWSSFFFNELSYYLAQPNISVQAVNCPHCTTTSWVRCIELACFSGAVFLCEAGHPLLPAQPCPLPASCPSQNPIHNNSYQSVPKKCRAQVSIGVSPLAGISSRHVLKTLRTHRLLLTFSLLQMLLHLGQLNLTWLDTV